MNAALGSQKWMTLHEYKTTAECIRALREKGFKIFATDLTSKSKLLREFINDSVQSSRSSTSTEFKLAIVMGNEEKGISQEVRELSDGTFYIPMHGFAESLNLSIATAVICEALDSASQSQSLSGSADRGLLAAHMAADLKSRIILTWLTRSVKGSLPLLRRAGLPVAGNSRFNSIGSVSTKP
jgi:tRNA(Leu) C34 or U34 (ribose-2'-O)-methylase TrmL